MKDVEQIRSNLIHLREMEQIKRDVLGESYATLGNVIFQILGEVYLSMIEGADFSGHDLAQATHLSDSLTKRFITVLEAEGYVELATKAQSELDGHLELTDLGTSKVEQIISECADTSSQEMESQNASAFFS